jgi:hypothetical protein
VGGDRVVQPRDRTHPAASVGRRARSARLMAKFPADPATS